MNGGSGGPEATAHLEAPLQVLEDRLLCERRQGDHVVVAKARHLGEEGRGVAVRSHREVAWGERHPSNAYDSGEARKLTTAMIAHKSVPRRGHSTWSPASPASPLAHPHSSLGTASRTRESKRDGGRSGPCPDLFDLRNHKAPNHKQQWKKRRETRATTKRRTRRAEASRERARASRWRDPNP